MDEHYLYETAADGGHAGIRSPTRPFHAIAEASGVFGLLPRCAMNGSAASQIGSMFRLTTSRARYRCRKVAFATASALPAPSSAKKSRCCSRTSNEFSNSIAHVYEAKRRARLVQAKRAARAGYDRWATRSTDTDPEIPSAAVLYTVRL
jgi:hypothetical protein